MDKIKLLQSRREQVLAAGTEIRKTISSLIDENSFATISARKSVSTSFMYLIISGTSFSTFCSLTIAEITSKALRLIDGSRFSRHCTILDRYLCIAAESELDLLIISLSLKSSRENADNAE